MAKSAFTIDDLPINSLKKLYQYWLDIRGERQMPSRANLNPADIMPLLPNIVLVDVEKNPRRYRSRLIGTATVNIMGTDMTGKYLDDTSNINKNVKSRYDWLVDEKRPYYYKDDLRISNKPYIESYGVALPLSSNGSEVDILMIGVHYQYLKEKAVREQSPILDLYPLQA